MSIARMGGPPENATTTATQAVIMAPRPFGPLDRRAAVLDRHVQAVAFWTFHGRTSPRRERSPAGCPVGLSSDPTTAGVLVIQRAASGGLRSSNGRSRIAVKASAVPSEIKENRGLSGIGCLRQSQRPHGDDSKGTRWLTDEPGVSCRRPCSCPVIGASFVVPIAWRNRHRRFVRNRRLNESTKRTTARVQRRTHKP